MDILKKLRDHLNAGVETEADALYLLTEVRKFLEQQGLKPTFEYLTFHCDWAVHAKLQGRMAQRVLEQFDKANIHLRTGLHLHELPNGLRLEIDRLSKLTYFENEFDTFLRSNKLPNLSVKRPDGWSHFLHLYIKIVEGCPLVMSSQNSMATVDKVTLRFELAKEPLEDEMLYKMTWEVLDKNGLSGDLFIINSFSLNPQ
jgi:hypothetical protein